jgi:hypothetical protein
MNTSTACRCAVYYAMVSARWISLMSRFAAIPVKLFLPLDFVHMPSLRVRWSLALTAGSGIEASWAGGIDGREVIDVFLPYIEVCESFHNQKLRIPQSQCPQRSSQPLRDCKNMTVWLAIITALCTDISVFMLLPPLHRVRRRSCCPPRAAAIWCWCRRTGPPRSPGSSERATACTARWVI